MDDLHDAETADDTPEARFGAELRRVRVHAAISVRRLAKDLDRAHGTISDFENGRRLPGRQGRRAVRGLLWAGAWDVGRAA